MEGIQIINNVKVVVKSLVDIKEINLPEDASIKELRDEVCKHFTIKKESFRLIHGGKVLEDNESLKYHKITDNTVVHLLMKSKTEGSPTLPTMGAVNGASFARLQARLQETLTANPEMLNTLLANPTVQQLIANPDVMKRLIVENPLCKEMLETNPEISQILTDSDLLRQNVKLAQNQSLLHKMVVGQNRDAAILEENDVQSSVEIDMLASEQLTGPPPPDMLTTALQMPYIQDMLTAMSQNEELCKKVMLDSPLCAGNPELQQYMAQTYPALRNQLSNPSIQAMFTNPKLFTTSLQVHDAMLTLNREEPSLFASCEVKGVTMPPPTPADYVRPVVAPATSCVPEDPLNQLMQKALNNMCSVHVTPEQYFAFQLEQLSAMGFKDQKRNMAAIQEAKGDITAAVDSLRK